MNLTRCENGHFYDVDKFAVCPHCQSQGDAEVTVALNNSKAPADSEPLTVAGGSGIGVTVSQKASPVQMTAPIQPNPTQSNPMQPGMVQPAPQPTSFGSPMGMNPFPAPMAPQSDDDNKTISIYSGTAKVEPVVGWLVCVDGGHFGESFKLKAGRNFVGRSMSMDVVLSNDNAVSRDRHATILFEPRKREFLAQPGESRELFYVNDEVVLNAQKLSAYDVLSIGNCKLVFVPFCNSEFGWDDCKQD